MTSIRHMPTWTRPYLGILHLNGLKKGFRVTINTLGTGRRFPEYFIVKVIFPGSFSSHSELTVDTIEQAKAQGELWANELRLWC